MVLCATNTEEAFVGFVIENDLYRHLYGSLLGIQVTLTPLVSSVIFFR